MATPTGTMSTTALSSEDPQLKYELVEMLGEGSYGAVYRSVNRKTREEVAIKILPSTDDVSKTDMEVQFMKRLRSPYIVSFIDGYNFDGELWIIMEYCAGGSMSDLYEATKKPIEENALREIVAFTTLGLNHLHSHRSIHRDIKAGNILLSSSGCTKLADFGVSANLTDTMQKRKTVIGTPFWMAPEVIQETSYDARADIWSLGITIIELCEGQPPHFNVHPMRAIFMIPMKPAPTFKNPSHWTPEMNSFLARCLQKKSEDRANTDELLSHPWIADTVKRLVKVGFSPILKELFDDNIDAIKRMRAGEEEPMNAEDKKEDENDKTLKRDNTSTIRTSDVAMIKRQQARNASLKIQQNNTSSQHNSQYDTMRTTDSSVFTTNTFRKSTVNPDKNDDDDDYSRTFVKKKSSDLDSDIHRDPSLVSEIRVREKKLLSNDDDDDDGFDNDVDYSGTMRFSHALNRASDDASVNSDVSAALKYFKKSEQHQPAVPAPNAQDSMNQLLHEIDANASDAKNAANGDDIALQELEAQIWKLEKQYQADYAELEKAYLTKRQILESAIKKLRSEMRKSNSSIHKIRAEMLMDKESGRTWK